MKSKILNFYLIFLFWLGNTAFSFTVNIYIATVSWVLILTKHPLTHFSKVLHLLFVSTI